ncbi:MAG: glycoside hydrolase family 95-like protein [Bacteroidota bacterium]
MIKVKSILLILFVLTLSNSFSQSKTSLKSYKHDLHFNNLATSWDEGIPLGNGISGVLLWQKDGKLRLSLDRADLWDLRPVKELQLPHFTYQWVYNQVMKGDYDTVQKIGDVPYESYPGPTKIPGGAIEFDIQNLGPVDYVHLYIKQAVCHVKFKKGALLEVFCDANKPTGNYRWSGTGVNIKATLIPPVYNSEKANNNATANSVEGQGLQRLGYTQGKVVQNGNSFLYHQTGWGNFSYDISLQWKKNNNTTEGVWCISTQNSDWSDANDQKKAQQALSKGFESNFQSHCRWWENYWNKSSVSIPDPLIERQWYLEMYKFGSASRRGAPPITLQAVWTADNGNLPPWKGDFHNDLNTQLSYWPSYVSNHIEEAKSYTDWINKCLPIAREYTHRYFNVDGINFAGVSTLSGQAMGGWIQYSMSPTVSAWLAHHYYLTYKYTLDMDFLRKEAYPFISEVAKFINALLINNAEGKKTLPLSSSPEIHDNSINAWYKSITNFDLSLIKFLFNAAAELAGDLGNTNDKLKWETIAKQLPPFALQQNNLLIAANAPMEVSHRHFSNLMAIYPLCLLNLHHPADSLIICTSLDHLAKLGPDGWCGYSWAWYAALLARANRADKAAEALRIFADAFCLQNSFHVNGDQKNKGYSQMHYRPFTLEGNFAFADALQQMLLQSDDGIIRIMPSVPEAWKDVSFNSFRAMGAFLISAEKKNGKLIKLKIYSEKGGKLTMQNPFSTPNIDCIEPSIDEKMFNQTLWQFETKAGKNYEFIAVN